MKTIATTVGAALAVVVSLHALAQTETSRAPLVHYSFSSTRGATLHDDSGHGHDGIIVNATWKSSDGRKGLYFDGRDAYVDLGDVLALKYPEDMTFLAWVRLEASPYPDGTTNWTILDCEKYRKDGFIFRVDGATSKLMYRSSQDGSEQVGFGTKVLSNHRAYLVGVVRRGGTVTLYVDGRTDGQFTVRLPGHGPTPLRISQVGQSFSGEMYDITLFGRALSGAEIAAEYWDKAACFGKDTSARGTIRVRPFIYYDENRALLSADFFGVLPLAKNESAVAELIGPGGKALQRHAVDIPDSARVLCAFDLRGLSPGTYELRAALAGSKRPVEAKAAFRYPEPPAGVPDPGASVAPPLPTPVSPPAYTIHVADSGGFSLVLGKQTLDVESSFSYPHGGENTFSCLPSTAIKQEKAWSVGVRSVGPTSWEIKGGGASYDIDRCIVGQRDRVLVRDTISNRTDEPVGIIFQNRVHGATPAQDGAWLAGSRVGRPVTDRDLKTCPTAFLPSGHLGVGLVALDDVSIVQSRGAFDGSGIAVGSKEFALDKGASCTLEWAVYVTGTADYYDLINAVRRDEHRNHVTVEGPLVFIPGTQRKRDVSLVPGADYFSIRRAAYATLYCLSWCTDDPQISVEGIEFTNYPKECARVRSMMQAMYRVCPTVKGMFHVAPQLYATNNPDAQFADSRVIGPDGKQVVYPYDYENGNYFSRARAANNWRWWIYYPTLTNSFGKALLKSVDTMMDSMHCRGVFADGFLWGYGSEYTYDRWDGHTADIDPKTKLITRKKGSVLLLTQDAMAAYCRKIVAKGGVVIANGVVPTRTICNLPLIVDQEVHEGPNVHLAPTPITLGDPSAVRSDQSLYRDVVNKLRAGNLYFFYGEPKTLDYEPLPARMYPITVQEIHAGYIKGKERLVTLNSGVYGWRGSRDLHVTYRYDVRGHRIRPGFVTTADAVSVRTRVELGAGEAAVVKRIPVSIETTTPVNLIVDTYQKGTAALRLNGRGTVTLKSSTGIIRTLKLDGPTAVIFPSIASASSRSPMLRKKRRLPRVFHVSTAISASTVPN